MDYRVVAVALAVLLAAPVPARPDAGARLVAAARHCVGDVYDAAWYTGGPPPKGRGACTDVVYAAWLGIGVNLQDAVDRDVRLSPRLYPSVRSRDIDYRWAPNLVVWFTRHAKRAADWRPGDTVFWSWSADHVADHCGIVSNRRGRRGQWLVIHNLGPACTEDDSLDRWPIVGHFRPKD